MICMLELIWARARLVLCSASLLAGSPATNLQYTVQYSTAQHSTVQNSTGRPATNLLNLVWAARCSEPSSASVQNTAFLACHTWNIRLQQMV